MTKLTEGMVIGRTRATDLASVRKLNCWGSELSDVSLVRQMKFVEVLSLSVNKITTLLDFAYCPNLQELYVRKNEVRDLSEILYLKDLPKLRNFWLEDNPCACAVGDRYRLTVLKYLPNLKKLDNIVVQPDEVRDAERYGLDLETPTEKQPFVAQSPTSEAVASPTGQNSTSSPPRTAHHLPPIERDNEFDCEGNLRQNYSGSSPDSHSPERKPVSVSAPSGGENDITRIPPREANHIADYSPPDDQSAARMNRRSRHETFMKSSSLEKDMTSPSMDSFEQKAPVMFVDHRAQQLPPISNPSPRERDYQEVVHQQHIISIQTPTNSHPPPQMIHSDVYGDMPEDHEPRYREEMYRYSVPMQQPMPIPILHPQLQGIHKHHLHGQLLEKILDSPNKPYPTRPKNRNSNILSAVLCLIKELDCASLEVVEMAVRCRMEELDD